MNEVPVSRDLQRHASFHLDILALLATRLPETRPGSLSFLLFDLCFLTLANLVAVHHDTFPFGRYPWSGPASHSFPGNAKSNSIVLLLLVFPPNSMV